MRRDNRCCFCTTIRNTTKKHLQLLMMNLVHYKNTVLARSASQRHATNFRQGGIDKQAIRGHLQTRRCISPTGRTSQSAVGSGEPAEPAGWGTRPLQMARPRWSGHPHGMPRHQGNRRTGPVLHRGTCGPGTTLWPPGHGPDSPPSRARQRPLTTTANAFPAGPENRLPASLQRVRRRRNQA